MLRPSLTLFDIFGPAHAYVPRADDGAAEWLPSQLDALTGGQLAVTGGMPVVCSAGFTTAAAAELLGLAGLEPGLRTMPFVRGQSRAVAESLHPSFRLVLLHALPVGHPLARRCWIDHELLIQLNDKGRLAALAPPRHVPERRIVDRASFFQAPDRALPFVVKAVTDQSTGGGFGVQLCRSPGDVQAAEARFESLDRVVVEEYLDIERAPCLNFVIDREGAVSYLGHSDQILSPEGRHQGNWIEQGAALPPETVEIAATVVRNAAGMGYRGIAGIDMVLTSDGRPLVLDLNFRTNASTAPLLLAPAIESAHGHKVLLSRRFEAGGSADAFARSLEPLVRSGQVIPLALFDPVAAGHADAAASVLALVGAASRQKALSIAEAVEALGSG